MATGILWSRSLLVVTAVATIGYEHNRQMMMMVAMLIIAIISMMTKKPNIDQFMTHFDKTDMMIKIIVKENHDGGFLQWW